MTRFQQVVQFRRSGLRALGLALGLVGCGSRARRYLVAALLLSALAACGSHATPSDSNTADQPSPECDVFLSAYEHCLDSLGPAWIAQARVEQTRTAFATQAAQGPAAGQALRKQCVDRLSQIKTTCR